MLASTSISQPLSAAEFSASKDLLSSAFHSTSSVSADARGIDPTDTKKPFATFLADAASDRFAMDRFENDRGKSRFDKLRSSDSSASNALRIRKLDDASSNDILSALGSPVGFGQDAAPTTGQLKQFGAFTTNVDDLMSDGLNGNGLSSDAVDVSAVMDREKRSAQHALMSDPAAQFSAAQLSATQFSLNVAATNNIAGDNRENQSTDLTSGSTDLGTSQISPQDLLGTRSSILHGRLSGGIRESNDSNAVQRDPNAEGSSVNSTNASNGDRVGSDAFVRVSSFENDIAAQNITTSGIEDSSGILESMNTAATNGDADSRNVNDSTDATDLGSRPSHKTFARIAATSRVSAPTPASSDNESVGNSQRDIAGSLRDETDDASSYDGLEFESVLPQSAESYVSEITLAESSVVSQFNGVNSGESLTNSVTDSATSSDVARAVPQQVEQAIRDAEQVRVGDSIEIELDPPELGRVVLQLESDGHRIAARFLVDDPGAARALEHRLSSLIESLQAADVTVDDIYVALQDRHTGNNDEQQRPTYFSRTEPGETRTIVRQESVQASRQSSRALDILI